MKKLFLKLNWRLLLIHTIAVFCFMYGIRQLFFFIYADEMKALEAFYLDERTFIREAADGQKVIMLIGIAVFWSHVSMFIGMLFASLISFVISKRKKIFWLNSLLVFIVSFLLIRGPVCDSYLIKTITTSVGYWFEKYGLEYVYFINGTLLTGLAVFLMFSRWTNRFIFRQ